MKNKIFDCIIFFRENLITNLRFDILNDFVDYFVVCESLYDHRGNKKKINFKLNNKKLKNKIIHIVIKEKFNTTDPWKAQALQREYIFKGIKYADDNDYIIQCEKVFIQTCDKSNPFFQLSRDHYNKRRISDL